MPPPEQQRLSISPLVNVPMREGQEYGVLPASWYRLWKDFVRFDGEATDGLQESDAPFPCAIDNTSLVDGMHIHTN